jgi:hypothetical protein
MTPLIVSCKNSHIDVAMYLTKKNETSLNHMDKVSLILLFLFSRIYSYLFN